MLHLEKGRSWIRADDARGDLVDCHAAAIEQAEWEDAHPVSGYQQPTAPPEYSRTVRDLEPKPEPHDCLVFAGIQETCRYCEDFWEDWDWRNT